MCTIVTYEVKDHVALVTLNRPHAANALSKQLLDELNDTIETIKRDESIYTVIITGAGEKAFCAGADLKERQQMNDDEVVHAVQSIGDTITHIESIPVPVIAAINGVAFGGGLELALACDIRIADKKVKVGLTETSLAIIPGAGGTQRLSRLISTGHAKRLIFTAEPIEAKEAFEIGLVEQVANDESALQVAFSMAEKIASNGPLAVQLAKKAIDEGIERHLSDGLALEHTYYKQTIPTEDRLEGLRAFSEKRKPTYKGK